jgi:hypothetical protein
MSTLSSVANMTVNLLHGDRVTVSVPLNRRVVRTVIGRIIVPFH